MALGDITAIHLPALSSGTEVRQLVFRRAQLVQDANGVLVPDWSTPFVVTVAASVQPVGGKRMLDIKLALGYGQAWTCYISGSPDIRQQDRTVIEGVEVIVESVQTRPSYLQLLCGARQAVATTRPGV